MSVAYLGQCDAGIFRNGEASVAVKNAIVLHARRDGARLERRGDGIGGLGDRAGGRGPIGRAAGRKFGRLRDGLIWIGVAVRSDEVLTVVREVRVVEAVIIILRGDGAISSTGGDQTGGGQVGGDGRGRRFGVRGLQIVPGRDRSSWGCDDFAGDIRAREHGRSLDGFSMRFEIVEREPVSHWRDTRDIQPTCAVAR